MLRHILGLLLICGYCTASTDASPVQGSARGTVSLNATPLIVHTVAHGVRFTLILPKRVFAVDEIARARMRVDNLTHRLLDIDRRCDVQNPEVAVRAANGFLLYPPTVDYLSSPNPCPSHTITLYAGASLITYPYVIMRARYLQASVTVSPKGAKTTGLGPGSTFVVRTAITRITLVPADKPAVQLCSYAHLCANVEPPFGLKVHGPMLYAFTARCGSEQIPRYVQSVWLQPAPANHVFRHPRNRVYPGCERPASWNLVVGWLGTPAAHVHFVRRTR